MQHPQDFSFGTAELLEICPRLRPDLQYSFRSWGGQMSCVIEDPINSAFYQIGMNEYALISLYDGRTAICEAISLTSADLGSRAFDDQEAISITRWLFDCGLATTSESVMPERLAEAAEEKLDAGRIQKLNPLMTKIPIFNPGPLLDRLLPATGWLFSWPVAIAWAGLCLLAIKTVAANYEELVAASGVAVLRNNWLWLLATIVVLKIIHELAHGISCRKFGGNVREAGVLMILFAPLPYVDVTSAWKFPCRWQRILVSLAGMFVEFGLAAVAILVWSATHDPLVRQHACNVALMGSVASIVFNANFLMRFDGYYVLSDWLGIPNLYTLGQQYTNSLGKRYLLGVDVDLPRWPAKQAWIIKTYGICALLWRVVIMAGIALAASFFFFGFGLILALVGIALWLGLPAMRLVRFLRKGHRGQYADMGRVGLLSGLAMVTVVAAFTVIPWPGKTTAPVITDFNEVQVVRAGAPGFVREIHVREGQTVQQDQLLAVLENFELRNRLAQLNIDLQQSQLASRGYHLQGMMPEYQAELSKQRAFHKQITVLDEQISRLSIRADGAGEVVSRNIESLGGKFRTEGNELFRIGQPGDKRLAVSVHQDDVERFQRELGRQVVVVMDDGQKMRVQLDSVEPQANDEIEYMPLAAVAGGPVPVRPASSSSSVSEWRYAQPRVRARIRLASSQSQSLLAGQTGTVKLASSDVTLGTRLYQLARDWWQGRVQMMRERFAG